MRFTPGSFGSLREFNPCHEPAGSAKGGQFCSQQRTVTRVGITSNRPPEDTAHARSRWEVQREGKRLQAALRKLKGVTGARVSVARGEWDGGGEPAWNVTYRGNGEAQALLMQTGRRWNQDAVLVVKSGGPHELREYSFGNIGPKRRAAVGRLLTKYKAGGWTWFRHKRDTVLRIVEAPGFHMEPPTWRKIVKALGNVGAVQRVRVKKVTATSYWNEGEGRRWGSGPLYREGERHGKAT